MSGMPPQLGIGNSKEELSYIHEHAARRNIVDMLDPVGSCIYMESYPTTPHLIETRKPQFHRGTMATNSFTEQFFIA